MAVTDKEYMQRWIELDRYAVNGVFTEPSDGRVFDIKKILEKVRELGRPLTEEEAIPYRIK